MMMMTDIDRRPDYIHVRNAVAGGAAPPRLIFAALRFFPYGPPAAGSSARGFPLRIAL